MVGDPNLIDMDDLDEPCPHGHEDKNQPCPACNEPKRVGALLCQLAAAYTWHPVHDPDYVKECPSCQAGDALDELREDITFVLGFRLQRKKEPGPHRLGDFLTWAIQCRDPLRELLAEDQPT